MLDDQIKQLAAAIQSADATVVFTGAGISTESGIPDFRGPNGVWKVQQPVLFQEFIASEDARERHWRFKAEATRAMAEAQPNDAHRAVTELHRRGKVRCVITQNIDELHQRSGMPEDDVLELHGNNMLTRCLNCNWSDTTVNVLAKIEASGNWSPTCECGGLLKPATISFGQAMPEDIMRRSDYESAHCGLFMVIGSSLTVMPAAMFPVIAKRSGAQLAILNRGETPHDEIADIRIDGSAGEIMNGVLRELDALGSAV